MKKTEFKVLQVRMDGEKFSKLDEQAKEEGITLSEYARQILFAEEANKKNPDFIERECINFFNRNIQSMSIFSFMSLKSHLKRSKQLEKAFNISREE